MVMRVFIPIISKNNKTGKGLFCYRLSQELKKIGVLISDNIHKKYDIALHIIKRKYKVRSRAHVVRLNGVYHDKKMKDYKSRNKLISDSLYTCDGVIYQSKFSKIMCNEYLGRFSGKSTIIPNGADPSFYNRIVVPDFREKFFLSASRWRPHKRIVDIVKSFLLADIKDVKLYIAGDFSKSGLNKREKKHLFKNKKIINLGRLDHGTLGKYMISAMGFIHLCWFDNCPNAVVESLCAGANVICNNVGGTPELIKRCGGFICNIDKKYDYKPCDLYYPPRIDNRIVADSILKSVKSDIEIDNSYVHIKNVAQKYYKFFKKFL